MKKILPFIIIIALVFTSGCAVTDKLGFTNSDFGYITDGTTSKIRIQNNRDKGYTFVITDPAKLLSFQKVLSTGNIVDKKSSYKPDYIISIIDDEGKSENFNYVVGDPGDGGNFYNDKRNYNVSSRLDSEVFRYFEDIRKPNDFEVVYYEKVIEKTLSDFRKEHKIVDKVTLNISKDVEVQKYLTSMDIKEYLSNIKNLEIVDGATTSGDITMSVDTTGFLTETSSGSYNAIYKAIIEFNDKKNNKEYKYYSVCTNKGDGWKSSITKEKPEGF